MKYNKTNVKDCFVIEINKNIDYRGYFEELFNEKNYQLESKQISHSFSYKGTLRGIHVSPYFKLITCLKGKIYDICVDLRKDSESYLNNFSITLTENENKQFLIPPNCGHGFLALEDSEIIYAQGGIFNKELDKNIIYNDKTIGIDWPKMDNYIISEKDLNANDFQ